MRKIWKFLLVSPAIFSSIVFAASTSIAGEIPASSPTTVAQVLTNSNGRVENNSQNNSMEQVNSVSQLSDVQPTDWAFQALQSLVERYGCIAGYPNGTYRGNRAMTRYEFAAGLNACLNRVNELIATATSDVVKKQDLATLQKLQEEYGAELAALRGRVDAVEAKTAELEAHQFSTTTKLNGVAIFAPVSIFAGDNARGDRINKNTIFVDRIRLNFDASFTGKDLLRTRIQATNFDALSGTSTFTPEGDLRFGGSTYGTGNNNRAGLDALLYSFPIGENTTVILEGNAGAADDFTNTVNPFLDGDGDSGALSNFGTRNPIYFPVAGSGAAIKHQFNKNLELSLGYLASSPSNPSSGNGLFNGPYGAIGQLTVKPINGLTIGLTYVNAYNSDLTAGSNRANLRSALLSENGFLPSVAGGPSQGTNPPGGSNAALPTNTLEALRGESLPVISNSYGIEASFQLSPKFVIGGWGGYTNARTLSTLGGRIPRGDLDIWNYAVTLAFPDLGSKGSVGGIIVGMEPRVTGVSRSLRNVIGKDPDISLHVEGLYQYKLSDNITITPGVIWITAPDHNTNNSGVVIGTVRTTFTF
ncbi:iron uptake porin [Aetokthonos hydrillicola Thurmond2011]|jgi:hypothetical protein|uniref:Iron uptake porin n=1 Tax=Aetokthonos hydrillicola Thurmond2011 TaxID=2712845 RepID=A0AAP5IBI8_9CYAN|nr:iron uptake porin [Aetokthonos hydrillicola]MBO3461986.1 iron uptake porin [Aetokthonos hydrillicola CCALA 1050]MBW4584311.1 iron uptake porin [Aetokthonos hydrillicola CCALA 1050]MDR9898481.1 iron uptake porin [Aetokthonos hydrillicola Thurmond2011]